MSRTLCGLAFFIAITWFPWLILPIMVVLTGGSRAPLATVILVVASGAAGAVLLA